MRHVDQHGSDPRQKEVAEGAPTPGGAAHGRRRLYGLYRYSVRPQALTIAWARRLSEECKRRFHKTWRKPGSVLFRLLLFFLGKRRAPMHDLSPAREGAGTPKTFSCGFIVTYPRPLSLAPASRRGPTRPGADLLRCGPAVVQLHVGAAVDGLLHSRLPPRPIPHGLGQPHRQVPNR